MPSRKDIVASARSFIGTKWRHQGRDRSGCDCVGLVVAVADDLGILPKKIEFPNYRRHPDGTMLNYFDRYMDRASLNNIREGTVVIFSFLNTPWHAGIVVNSSSPQAVIHAFATQKRVVTDYLHNKTNGRQIVRAYDYRGIADG